MLKWNNKISKSATKISKNNIKTINPRIHVQMSHLFRKTYLVSVKYFVNFIYHECLPIVYNFTTTDSLLKLVVYFEIVIFFLFLIIFLIFNCFFLCLTVFLIFHIKQNQKNWPNTVFIFFFLIILFILWGTKTAHRICFLCFPTEIRKNN